MLPAPSRLSVSNGPDGCLRRRCSSRYLQISPLHLEFRHPLPYSSVPVSNAVPRLSRGLPRQTLNAACAPFTPNDSEQRSPPTCYRGCWHVVSRGLFRDSCHRKTIACSPYSSSRKGLYNLAAFFAHAASLRQACAHCGRFLAAASRRSLDRVSVPVWPFTLSGRLPIVAMVGSYPAIQLMGRGPILRRRRSAFPLSYSYESSYKVLIQVSLAYPSPKGRLSTCYSPVRRSRGIVTLAARLACLKRAASVRSEPGSNSPSS